MNQQMNNKVVCRTFASTSGLQLVFLFQRCCRHIYLARPHMKHVYFCLTSCEAYKTCKTLNAPKPCNKKLWNLWNIDARKSFKSLKIQLNVWKPYFLPPGQRCPLRPGGHLPHWGFCNILWNRWAGFILAGNN